MFILSGPIGTVLRFSLTLVHRLAGAWFLTPSNTVLLIILLLQRRKWKFLVVTYVNDAQSVVAKWGGPLLAQVWSQDTCPLLLCLQACTQQTFASLPCWTLSVRSYLTWHHHPINLFLNGMVGAFHSFPPMSPSPTKPFSRGVEGCSSPHWPLLLSVFLVLLGEYMGKKRLKLITCYLQIFKMYLLLWVDNSSLNKNTPQFL